MNHNVVFRWDLSICPVEIVEIINNIRSNMAGYGCSISNYMYPKSYPNTSTASISLALTYDGDLDLEYLFRVVQNQFPRLPLD